MQYFSEAVLHCSWLNRLFPAGHHIDLTVILKPSEQRKQAIRDRNCSFRTFAFRLSDDELGLFGSCSALITTNQPFSKWGEVFSDNTLANAILDRLLHH